MRHLAESAAKPHRTRAEGMLHERKIQAEIPSLQGKVAPEEWQARVDLAACYRLVALYEMSDMVANHISMRVPGEENAFLINAYGMLYEEITASSLIKIDHEGNILAKPDFGPGLDYGINRAGFVIHSAVHEAKPDVACVIHTHTWAGMAIASLECGLLPLTQTAMRFAKIGYHDYHGVVLDLAEQEELVKNLGDNNAMILRNHGLLTTGRTIAEAFNAMHRLEMSCRSQLAAMACGVKLNKVPDDIVEKTYMNYQPQVRRPFGVMEWPALLRKLDKIDPSYRN
jgi:ribulose-5-phosphate 4-epimerase/fuculose-1-phosphate aldolase